MPILTHTTIVVDQGEGSEPLLNKVSVLSAYYLSESASLNALNKNLLKLYPNPVTNNLTIEGSFSENASAKIMDCSGRVLMNDINLTSLSKVDVSNLSTGVYYMTIIDGENVVTRSFNVQ